MKAEVVTFYLLRHCRCSVASLQHRGIRPDVDGKVNLLRLSLNRFRGPGQNCFPPGGIIISSSVEEEMASVVSAIRVGMNDFQAVDVANLR